MNRTYICIDLKSFYASVELAARDYDPLTTNLVVADAARTEKTICLAVSPSLKALGISGRARLFEVIQRVNEVNASRFAKAKSLGLLSKAEDGRYHFTGSSFDAEALAKDPSLELTYIVAPPRMMLYEKVSTQIYSIYSKYISPDDIHVYSIDECFLDVTAYLNTYRLTAQELAIRMIRDVLSATKITATVGIGDNMYLAKIAMDIVAKHVPADEQGVRIACLDEKSYREKLWCHLPLTDFWRVGRGIAARVAKLGCRTMGDIARLSVRDESLLYSALGINAELLIDHAWGWEPTEIATIKSYRPESRSLSSGQVLKEPYGWEKGRLIVREMTELLVLELVSKGFVTKQITLTLNYDKESLEALRPDQIPTADTAYPVTEQGQHSIKELSSVKGQTLDKIQYTGQEIPSGKEKLSGKGQSLGKVQYTGQEPLSGKEKLSGKGQYISKILHPDKAQYTGQEPPSGKGQLSDKGQLFGKTAKTKGKADTVYIVKKTGAIYQGQVTSDRYGRLCPKHAHGTGNLERWTSSTSAIMDEMMALYDRIVDKDLLLRHVNIAACGLITEAEIPEAPPVQMNLFTDYEALEKEEAKRKAKEDKERRLQKAALSLQSRFGKNIILKGMNLLDGGTTIERNEMIGGHRAGSDALPASEDINDPSHINKRTLADKSYGTLIDMHTPAASKKPDTLSDIYPLTADKRSNAFNDMHTPAADKYSGALNDISVSNRISDSPDMQSGSTYAKKDAKTIYADIIDLPRWQPSGRPRMSLYERSAQFSAYKTLSGYEDMVIESSRLTEHAPELEEYELNLLDRKLRLISESLERGESPLLTFTVFFPDERKDGGRYEDITEAVKKVDKDHRKIILTGNHRPDLKNMEIYFDQIVSIR